MEFSDRELEELKYALEYLHNADLCNYGEENIRILEGLWANWILNTYLN